LASFFIHNHTLDNNTQPPFYSHYAGQTLLVKNWRILLVESFDCPHSLANSNQRIRIREKILEIFSTVISTGRAKKRGHRLMTIILSNLNRFTNFFLTGRFLRKFAVKWIINIPQHLAYVATLPCEKLMSAKAINDKLQGSVATYLASF